MNILYIMLLDFMYACVNDNSLYQQNFRLSKCRMQFDCGLYSIMNAIVSREYRQKEKESLKKKKKKMAPAI